MKFRGSPLGGAGIIEMDKRADSRGFFARAFCVDEFGAAGLEAGIVQVNNSLSLKAGTLRGMHYQLPPAAEVKIVRCIGGSLWDCIIDLRPDSATFGQWFGAVLSAENRLMMYVPKGFAHGFITLSDEAELLYLVSARHAPDLERGLRWDDPRFAIAWPREPCEISAKDAAWPLYDADYHGVELFRADAVPVRSREGAA